jgi:hypothetical protein
MSKQYRLLWMCRVNREGHVTHLAFLGLGYVYGVNKCLSLKEMCYTYLSSIKDRVYLFLICNNKIISSPFDSNLMKTVKINGNIVFQIRRVVTEVLNKQSQSAGIGFSPNLFSNMELVSP